MLEENVAIISSVSPKQPCWYLLCHTLSEQRASFLICSNWTCNCCEWWMWLVSSGGLCLLQRFDWFWFPWIVYVVFFFVWTSLVSDQFLWTLRSMRTSWHYFTALHIGHMIQDDKKQSILGYVTCDKKNNNNPSVPTFSQTTNENANPTQWLVDFSTSTLSDLMTSTSTSTFHILAVFDSFWQSKNMVGHGWTRWDHKASWISYNTIQSKKVHQN